MNETFFIVDEELEGGFSARSLGESVFTEAETVDELYEQVRDAVHCHFDPADQPVRLLFV